jgi:hypothetical protein
MADVKISALSAIASVAGEDLVAIIDDPSGTPASRKATMTQILTYIDANITALQNLVEDTTPDLGGTLTGSGFDQTGMGTISMTEQAAANADVAGDGQMWVKTATPNQLWFTDDAGTDFQLASLAGTETFTNKTLTTPVISSISNTGTLTLPTSTDTLVGKATTDTLTNKSIVASQLTGIIADARMPNLTGDITTSEGAVATTLSSTLSVIGTQQQWIPAGAWGTVTTNGAEFAELELATNDIMLQTFDFDTTTSEKIQFWWHPPSNWNAGTITFQAYWTAASGSGTAIFSLAGQSLADSDAIDQALGTAQTSTDTLITANDMHISPESSAITIADATKNEPVILQVSRDISDTLGVDAKLVGIKIIYTIDTATSS